MIKLPSFLEENKSIENDYRIKRYVDALNAYVNYFGDKNDLSEYISTWDYSDNDFLELAKKLENCVIKKKRYKYLYLTAFDRLYRKTIYRMKNKYIDE